MIVCHCVCAGDRVERRMRLRRPRLCAARTRRPGDRSLGACDGVHIDDIYRRRWTFAARGVAQYRRCRGAGAAARLGETRGVSLTIVKGLPLSSGLGGSAASAAAAVVAVDALIGAHRRVETLVACALEGESLGAGSAHARQHRAVDLRRLRAGPPRRILPTSSQLPVPAGLTAVVVHPDLEIETAKARALLGDTVPLGRRGPAVGQPRRVRARTARGDFASDRPIARRHDRRAAPRAAGAGLAAIKRAAADAGALGCSLSGSGPSLFALCAGRRLRRAWRRQ